MPSGEDWAAALADIAVIKQIQTQQAAALLKMDVKMDLIWNAYQQNLGAFSNEKKIATWWRWAVSALIAVVGYRIWQRP